MAKFNNSFRALLISFAAVGGLALGACQDDDNGDEDVPLDVQNACNDYCERSVDCDDDRNEQDCRDECYDAMGSCMADEQDQALEELAMCASEACDDFFGCTVDAGAACYFGL